MFYDRVYNLPDEVPPESVIKNDEKLDQWIKAYNLRKKSERTGKKGPKSAKDHSSVFSFGRKK